MCLVCLCVFEWLLLCVSDWLPLRGVVTLAPDDLQTEGRTRRGGSGMVVDPVDGQHGIYFVARQQHGRGRGAEGGVR